MLTHLRRSIVFAAIAIVLTLAYGFLGTGVAQLFFRHQADGSITAHGSTLIGQNWSSPAWFHGRPDDSGPYAANPKKHISGGDNPLSSRTASPVSPASTALGPRSKVLLANTRALVRYWHHFGVTPTADLVTTSGSGYDPDITRMDADRRDPDGDPCHWNPEKRSTQADQPGEQQRRTRLPRLELHRRLAAQRGSRRAAKAAHHAS